MYFKECKFNLYFWKSITNHLLNQLELLFSNETMTKDLKIDLTSLPNKGLNFYYNQQSEDLTKKLKSLIGDNDYNIKVHIHSEGHFSYSISGKIQTYLNLLCARCAYEFKKAIDKEFKEKIFLQKKLTRIDKQVKSNHFSELINKEDFTVVENSIFDIGDFLHELIAIEEPLRPLKSEACDDDSLNCEHLESMKQKINQSDTRKVFFSKEICP